VQRVYAVHTILASAEKKKKNFQTQIFLRAEAASGERRWQTLTHWRSRREMILAAMMHTPTR